MTKSALDFPDHLWPFLRAFARAELMMQREHATCFQCLAELLERAWDAPEGKRFADVFRSIATVTLHACEGGERALASGDRRRVTVLADSFIDGYMRGLAVGRWGDEFRPHAVPE